MAKTVALSTLRTNVYNRGEFRDSYLSNAEVNAMINASIAELTWKILEFNQDYYLTCKHYDVVNTAVTGTGDSLAVSSGVVTLTDAGASFNDDAVDRLITISSASTAANNGTFPITTYTSGTAIKFVNDDGANETSSFAYSIAADRYALPSDFWLARGADILDTSSEWQNMHTFNHGERNVLQGSGTDRLWTRYRIVNDSIVLMPCPTWAKESGLRLWYVPTPTVLSGDADTWDTVAGFDEWVVLNCCVKGCAKEGTDPSVFMAQQAKVEKMVERAVASRDVGEPNTVRDVYEERSGLNYWPTFWRP